ncbi:MAG: tungstate transport system substrate-binding protein [Syntrophus sp. SKADARSKE-3]|nr:tungstate transport system substrate-binding protein [Syntrophus sp. SKADARSKE-3]
MKKLPLITILIFMFALPGAVLAEGRGFILLASTIAPIDSGIVPLLEEQFEAEAGIRVRHVGAGTGEALKIAQKGQIDLVIVHAKTLEEQFIHDGFGTQRIPLMYNDFVIVGPATDPAGIRGLKSATAALKMIADKGSPFISRGDKSGTHMAEMELWRKAGLTPDVSWYKLYEKGAEGNAPTLTHTDKIGAYTVIDRATYLSLKKKITLAILVEGDETLLNYISLIPVNPEKFPAVNAEDTNRFVQWLTSPAKGQRIIRDFGKDKYGSPLFFPNSEAWNKENK